MSKFSLGQDIYIYVDGGYFSNIKTNNICKCKLAGNNGYGEFMLAWTKQDKAPRCAWDLNLSANELGLKAIYGDLSDYTKGYWWVEGMHAMATEQEYLKLYPQEDEHTKATLRKIPFDGANCDVCREPFYMAAKDSNGIFICRSCKLNPYRGYRVA